MHPSRNEKKNQYCFKVFNLERYPVSWSPKACLIAGTIGTAEAKHKIIQVLFHLSVNWIKRFHWGVLLHCSRSKTNVPFSVSHLTLSSSNIKYARGEVIVSSYGKRSVLTPCPLINIGSRQTAHILPLVDVNRRKMLPMVLLSGKIPSEHTAGGIKGGHNSCLHWEDISKTDCFATPLH